MTHVKLSDFERVLLVNQYRILEGLYPDEAKHFEQNRKAIEMGFTRQYDQIFDALSEVQSEEDQQEVVDILNMHRDLLHGFMELKERSGLEEKAVRFRGFDQNEELDHYLYAQYLLEDLDRFQESQPAKNESLNSHCSTLQRYRNMLMIWRELDGRTPTKEEMLQIVNA